MNNSELDKIRPFVEKHFEELSIEFDSQKPAVPLVHTPYGAEEVVEALESLMSTYVTMGDKVEDFEKKWSDYLGTGSGVMTNSGSSANLLALKTVAKEFDSDAEVIVPAVCWSTAVYPIIDAGATPVFVDVEPESFMVDVEELRSAVNKDTEAVMLVHLLGNPAKMDEIVEICNKHDLRLIEDCAEAHGAEFKGRKVGTFGDIGTFSFSFSHHITTTEGGMAVTDSANYRKGMKILRSWGRVRDVKDVDQVVEEPDEVELDFMFADHGYNVRPTEIQAAMGLHQVEKMDSIVDKRRENARYLNEGLRSVDDLNLLEERSEVVCSYLHYPILIDQNSSYNSDDLREYLEKEGIETRPLLSGDITRHPAFQNGRCRVHGDLAGASYIHDKGLYISCHQYLTEDHMDYMIDTIRSFFEG